MGEPLAKELGWVGDSENLHQLIIANAQVIIRTSNVRVTIA